MPVFVKFTAEWCGICDLIGDEITQLALPKNQKAIFLAIDIDENDKIAERYDIYNVPTIICFKN